MADTEFDGRTSLQEAVARAIAENRELARVTADELLALADALRPTTSPTLLAGAEQFADSAAELVLDAERTLLAEITDKLKELAHRQLDGTDSFNIVLFGRTGTGKSSLLEAFQHGDGESISPGNSDWTTTVNPVSWAHCRLVDTPGIEGWGRTMSREDLEEQARQELITADIVVLCFDTQNQKAGEFRKVADWIAEFRKPAIAVLNVRQPNWRFPRRVAKRTRRLRASQTVADHAAHVDEGLTAIGLVGTPVIAMNTQRAVFARAREPFRVADQLDTMLSQRAEVGADLLLEWSNLPLLEQLLTTAVENGAARLRRGVLLNQLQRTVNRLSEERLPAVREQATVAAEQAEAGIERMLDLLGAPEVHRDELGTDDPGREAVSAFLQRLRELEELRAGTFAAPATGTVRKHSENVISGLLAPVRAAARERAEALVEDAMAHRRKVDRDEFERTVFVAEEIDEVAATAVRQLTGYLQKRIGIAAEDVVADLRAVGTQSATVSGTAGRGYRRSAIGVTVLAAAAIVAWGTGGWVLAAGAVAGLAIPPFRRFLRKLAVKRHEKELSRARGEAREAVTRTFDGVRDGIADWFLETARNGLLAQLTSSADQALVLRAVAATAVRNQDEVLASAGRIQEWVTGDEDPGGVLRTAMRDCERTAGISGPAGRSLWLGESWCDDPDGLREGGGPDPRSRRPAGEAILATLARGRLRPVLTEAARVPSPGSGQYWLAQLDQLLAGEETAAPLLARLAGLVGDHSPRILLYGDYNVGKSSFVRRLLADEGEPIPETLTVRGRPETKRVSEYQWGRFRLIDTPGLQSGLPDHDAAAHRSIPDAALIIYMLGANAVTSDRAGLDLVLHGDPDRGVLPKLDRTLFVVNRADELSVDAFADPEGFARAVARRERELRDALVGSPQRRRAGFAIPAERILFVASDPFGQIGEDADVTGADFDEYRDWDGMDELRTAFDELGPGLQANSVDVSVLHAGVGALGALLAAAQTQIDTARTAVAQLGRLADDLRDRTQVGDLLISDRGDALTRLCLGFVDQIVREALQIDDEQRRRIRLDKAVHFFEDADLLQQLQRWSDETGQRIEEWGRETSIVLERRVESPAFQQASHTAVGPTAARPVPHDVDARQGDRRRRVVRRAGRPAAGEAAR